MQSYNFSPSFIYICINESMRNCTNTLHCIASKYLPIFHSALPDTKYSESASHGHGHLIHKVAAAVPVVVQPDWSSYLIFLTH
jgi:hypothetical protein